MSTLLHKGIHGIAALTTTIATLLMVTHSGAADMNGTSERFDFEYYEHLKVDQAKAAREFLLQKYPVGSDAKAALKYVESGGAKCVFAHERNEDFYFCQYTRPGRGFMALASSIEWTVVISTNVDGSETQNIGVGRNAVGF